MRPDKGKKSTRPLIPVVLFLMAGILLGSLSPGLPPSYVYPAGLFIALWILFRPGRRKVVFLLLFFMLGYSRLEPIIHHVNPFAPYAYNGRWRIEGTVDSLVEHFSDRTRFIIDAVSLAKDGVRHHVPSRLRITVRSTGVEIFEGDRIACTAKIRLIRNFNNPGVFDYRRHMLYQGVEASAWVSEERFHRLPSVDTTALEKGLFHIRKTVFDFIDRASPGLPRGVLRALVMGDRSELPTETRDMFSRIGVAHLLAISGLHMGMVATLAFSLFRFLLGRSERILIGGWAIRGAALASVVPVLVYGVLAGRSPSTGRSVIMVLMFLLAIVWRKETDGVNTLTVAALVILLVQPTALFSISFQLSFCAVLAILVTLQKVSQFLRPHTRPLPVVLVRIFQFFLVSLAATLGTLPIVLYYFNQVSFVGLLANGVMVPLVGFVVVPLGLLSVLLLPVTGTGALWILERSMDMMAICLQLGGMFERFSFVSAKTVTPTLLEIVLFYAAAWSFFNLKRTSVARVVMLIVLVAGVADTAYWVKRRFYHEDLRVTYLDVGQGSAALLEIPGGQCMLVDGGGFFNHRFDVGARVLAPFLWSKKIGRVETLVLSHPHPDHLNGLLFIARHFKVQEVWMTGDSSRLFTYVDFLTMLDEKKIPIRQVRRTVPPRTIGPVRFDVLYPPSDFQYRKARDPWRDANNNSLVLKATMGDISFLFPGDIEKEGEQELVACGDLLNSDVLMVPHHGSRTSSTTRFLTCVSPRLAVVSAGWKNIFHFPHAQVLDRYRLLGCPVLRTDQDGAITVITDGEGLVVRKTVSSRR